LILYWPAHLLCEFGKFNTSSISISSAFLFGPPALLARCTVHNIML
jgi:hypothetical protein